MQLPLLPVLPALPPLPELPSFHQHSPWFPLDRAPWEHGRYQIKIDSTEQLQGHIAAGLYLWDGREWADKLPKGSIAWRGLGAKP